MPLTPTDTLVYTANELGRCVDNIALAQPTTPFIDAILGQLTSLWSSVYVRALAYPDTHHKLIYPESLKEPKP